IGGWMQDGVKPVDGLGVVKDKLMVADVRDRSAVGNKGKDVTLGSGAAGLADFFLAAFRAEIKPLLITIDAAGAPDTYADLLKSMNGFVREGGGIGGNHAVTFADNNWPEFAEMMGGWAGAHHTEKQMVKVDDPSSPLMKSFGPMSFEHTDEFYQFPVYSPYSREKQHVL